MAFQSAFVKSIEMVLLPDHSPVKYFDDDDEVEFLGRCLCGRVGNPNSQCDTCRVPFVPPLGRCTSCLTAGLSVSGTAGTKCYYCDGILIGDEPPC